MPNSLGLKPECVVHRILSRLLPECPQWKVNLLNRDSSAAAIWDVRVTDLEGGERARLANHTYESPEALLGGEVLDGIPIYVWWCF